MFLCRFVNVLLPPAARALGVRIRWWQPQHDGADHSDWALDNVLISGSDAHTQISDTFSGVALPSHERAPADGTHARHSGSFTHHDDPVGMTSHSSDLLFGVFGRAVYICL